MGAVRLTLAVLAAAALAATLALLAMAAPGASRHYATGGEYCPDKTARQSDAAQANAALKKANANVTLKTKALARAHETHKGVAGAQKGLRLAKGRDADAKAAAHDANAALADCG